MRLGYVIRSDGERYFVPACKLLDNGYEVRHLRLVKPPPLAGDGRLTA